MFLDITDRVLMEKEKAQLEAQNVYLQEEIRSQHNFVEIVGNSRPLLRRATAGRPGGAGGSYGAHSRRDRHRKRTDRPRHS